MYFQVKSVFLLPVLEIESRGAVTTTELQSQSFLSFILSFSILRQNLSKLPWLILNPQSFCLSLLKSWDNRPVLSFLAQNILYYLYIIILC